MKCLIVEDDAPLRAFLQMALEDMGHEVTTRENKAAALRTAWTSKFDLLLCDYHLPDGEALPIIEHFGTSHPNSRVILLTGSGVFPNGEVALLAPNVDWTMRKPVDLGDLAAIIDYAARDQERHRTRVGCLG